MHRSTERGAAWTMPTQRKKSATLKRAAPFRRLIAGVYLKMKRAANFESADH